MSDMPRCTKYNLTGQIQNMTYSFKLVEVPMLHSSRFFFKILYNNQL